MRNLRNFVKRNWFTFLLLVIIIVMFIMMNEKPSQKSDVLSAPEIGQEVAEQSKAVPAPANTETFCFRLDGREDMHLPALMGTQAREIYPNGLPGGVNWALSPTSSGEEDYGVLADGTIFAKKDFLDRWGMSSYVEIKCDRTAWAAQRMEEALVGGEEAYVYEN